MRLNKLMLWTKLDTYDENTCYIVDAVASRAELQLPSGVAVIILGSCDESLFRDVNADILVWNINRREMNFREQVNMLSSIFFSYQRWERDMMKLLVDNAPLPDLITLGEQEFHNNLLVLDSSFSLLFESKRVNPLDWEHSGANRISTLPSETIEYIRISPEYRQRARNHGLFHVSNDVLNCNSLFIQIQRGNLLFYLALLETDSPLTEAHGQMLTAFAEFMYLSLRNRRFTDNRSAQFTHFMERVLANEKVEKSEFMRQLAPQNWQIDDSYLCFALELNFWNKNDIDPYSISRTVDERLPGCFSFYYNERIVCLANLTRAQLDRNLYLELLATFVRDQLFHVGVSYDFTPFYDVVYCYQQAIASLRLGRNKHPNVWLYRFEKYALDYFIQNGLSKIDARHLCHPDLITLAQYDKEHNTDYLQTLRVYLSCGMNITDASAELYIHRNTLYQRISKIEQLIHSQLSRPRNRLYMQLSYSFMDFPGYNAALN